MMVVVVVVMMMLMMMMATMMTMIMMTTMIMLFWDLHTCSPRPPVNGQNFDRRLLSTILDSGTRPYMPGKRATSPAERAIMLLTALKPDRMGAQRARLLNREQRRPFVLRSEISQAVSYKDNLLSKIKNNKKKKYPTTLYRDWTT